MGKPENNLSFRAMMLDRNCRVNGDERLKNDVFAKIMALITEGDGLDYDAIDLYGEKPLGHLVFNLDNAGQSQQMLKAMVDQGCNPLLACDRIQRKLLGDTIWLSHLEHALAHREAAGIGMRDHKGGNLYHVVAGYNPMRFADMAANYQEHHEGIHSRWSIIEHGQERWLRARRADGQTPLHTLWDKQTLMDQFGDPPDRDQVLTVGGWLLKATRDLMLAEGDMLAEDAHGVTPWQLMNEWPWDIIEGSAQLSDELKDVEFEIRARMENQMLAMNTPAPGVRSRTGTRL